MRFLAAALLGVLLGTGTVAGLVRDVSAAPSTPTRAVFHNLTPYKPPPESRAQYAYGSGG